MYPNGAIYWYGKIIKALSRITSLSWTNPTFVNDTSGTVNLNSYQYIYLRTTNNSSNPCYFVGIGTDDTIDVTDYSLCKMFISQKSNYATNMDGTFGSGMVADKSTSTTGDKTRNAENTQVNVWESFLLEADLSLTTGNKYFRYLITRNTDAKIDAVVLE